MIWKCPKRKNCIPYGEENYKCRSRIPLLSPPFQYRGCEIYQQRRKSDSGKEPGPIKKAIGNLVLGTIFNNPF